MRKSNDRQGIADTTHARIYYKERGQGIPILMLHGNAETHLVFEYYEKRLSTKYRTILMDSRAHGKSKVKPEYGKEEFSIKDMAEDVAELLDFLHIDSCILLGFSDGANVALEFASRFPSRTLAVIAVSGNMNPEGLILPLRLYSAGKYKILKMAGGVVHKISPKREGRGRLEEWIWYHQQLAALLCNSPRMTKKELQNIKSPVLLAAGTLDVVKYSHSKRMARLIPGARLLLVKGATHTAMFIRKEFYLKAIYRFLNSIHPVNIE